MAIRVSAETVIARPRDDVAAFASDPANDAAWIGGVVAAAMVSEPPMRAGSRVRRTATFLGRRFDYETEVTEWDPPASLAMRATSPFPMEIRYEFEPEGAGTRARVLVAGEGSGFFRPAEPLLARQVRGNITKDLQRLKALLESGR